MSRTSANPSPSQDISQEIGQGFTLVELMVVVAIIAILAVVAIVGYQRHIRSGRLVSARAFIAQIKASQETYFQQFGAYCDASGAGTSATGNFHPPLVGGQEPVPKAWNPSLPAGFSDLGAAPNAGRTFASVFVHASIPNVNPAQDHALVGSASALGVPPQPASPAAPQPWYYIIGHLDLDGNQTSYTNGGCAGGINATGCSVLTTTSAVSTIVVRNEGN